MLDLSKLASNKIVRDSFLKELSIKLAVPFRGLRILYSMHIRLCRVRGSPHFCSTLSQEPEHHPRLQRAPGNMVCPSRCTQTYSHLLALPDHVLHSTRTFCCCPSKACLGNRGNLAWRMDELTQRLLPPIQIPQGRQATKAIAIRGLRKDDVII
jgi:hypothetical protein